MLANKHPDYEKEKRYLYETKDLIKKEIFNIKKELEKLEKDFKKLKKTEGGSYSNELVIKSQIYDSKKKKLKQLEKAKNKPYFGRIDFKEIDKDLEETFYIGKTSVVKSENDKRYVLDWRAPIAGLYYSGELGDVMYTAPDGLIMGDLNLKRQYEIEDKLINIFDKGLTPMDEFLQNALWEKKDNRLKDIVNTIQSEQNDIIRAKKDNTIIVQGVAGSGKTTIILHRIAYLMYTYKEMFRPENVLIIVPNNLFLDYISDVLPDLGVEDITQMTIDNLFLKLIKKDYNFLKEDKLKSLLNENILSREEKEEIKFISSFKGSIGFKKILDDLINDISNTIVPKCDLIVENKIIYTFNEIKTLFEIEYNFLPIIPRVNRIKKYIKETIDDRLIEIKNEIVNEYDKLISKEKRNIKDNDKLKKKLKEIYNSRDSLINKYEINSKKAIKAYFDKWPKLNIKDLYIDLTTNYNILSKYTYNILDESKTNSIILRSKRIINKGYFEREDLAPLLYLEMKLIGIDMKGKFSHIIVDEAQDYSPFQMVILKELNSNNSFTIVGDLSQGIYSYKGINSWNELIEDVFDKEYVKYLTIKKCYRSTMEIMNFANEVIKNYGSNEVTLAEPVLRSGNKPYLLNKKSEKEIIKDIESKIYKLKQKGFKSISIICKNSEECNRVYNKLNIKSQIITEVDTHYDGGVVIIPTYLTKGLEFDAVIIFNCSKDNYLNEELFIKVLYISITRALHEVYIYFKDKVTPLIDSIDESFYNKE